MRIMLLLLLSKWVVAQNIVPNSGFEDIEYCPSSPGRIQWAHPWSTSANSPDLYNTCGWNGYGVPINRSGVQNAHRGEGYAGFATYSEDWHGLNIREFLKCPLSYPLVSGIQYYVEFHVSQADSLQFATHNIGVTFTTVDTGQFGELVCWPDCPIYYENTSVNPLSSKTEWMKVSGTFTAIGGERYIHIGNFRTDDGSEIEFVGGGTDPNTVWNQASYFIDDVWLSHIDSADYVGVGEQLAIDNEQLSIWPNPASESLRFKVQGLRLEELKLTITDMLGRAVEIEFTEAYQGTMQAHVGHLAGGVYLLSVKAKDGRVWRTDFLKE